MKDYEFLFSKELHKRLKSKVKGKVWVNVYDDELHVKITTYDGEINYEFATGELSTQILNGLSTDYIAYSVVKDYKKFLNQKLNNKYFI